MSLCARIGLAALAMLVGACGGSEKPAPPPFVDAAASDGSSSGGDADAAPVVDNRPGEPVADAGRESAGADTSASPDAPPRDGQGGTGGADGTVTGPDGPADSAGPAVDSAPAGDAAMACRPPGTCDPFSITSCPMGQVCYPQGMTSATSCLNAANATRREDEGCGGAMGECGPGLICTSSGRGLLCHRMCPKGSIGFCGATKRCNGVLLSSDDACVRICLNRARECDIYNPDACAETNELCAPTTDAETGQRYNGCRAVGTRMEGEPCGVGGAGVCMRGLICVSMAGGTTGMCYRVCRPGGTPACIGGKMCTGMTGSGVTFCI